MPQYDMPPKERTIIPPVDGWRPLTYYIVEAAFSTTNPMHDYIFFTGFLNGRDNTPGGYNHFDNTDDYLEIRQAHYLKVKDELATKTPEGIVKA